MKLNILVAPGLIQITLGMIKHRIGGKAKSAHDAVAKSLELMVVSLVKNSPGGGKLTF